LKFVVGGLKPATLANGESHPKVLLNKTSHTGNV